MNDFVNVFNFIFIYLVFAPYCTYMYNTCFIKANIAYLYALLKIIENWHWRLE